LKWNEFFRQRPIGWREDDRTHKLLQVQGVKAPGEEIFVSLAQMKELAKERQAAKSEVINSLVNSQLGVMLLNSVGGHKLGN
jgi:hypothetical protein